MILFQENEGAKPQNLVTKYIFAPPPQKKKEKASLKFSRSLLFCSTITHFRIHLRVSDNLLECFRFFFFFIPCREIKGKNLFVICFMNLLPCAFSLTFGIFDHGMK
jgi:hypothetical protein